MARFLLQACQADDRNPITLGIIRVTDPILRPLRLLLPPYREPGYRLVRGCLGHGGADVLRARPVGRIDGQRCAAGSSPAACCTFCCAFPWTCSGGASLIVIIASFLAQGRLHPALQLLHQVTEPLLAPARRIIPPMGGMDFSPILVILLLGILQRILPQLFGAIF